MRTATETHTYYTFTELSDKAKDKVRDWLMQDWGEVQTDWIYEDAATVADLMGLDIRQTRKTRMDGSHYYDATIYWSGFSSQGDGACFEGTYKYKAGSVKAVMAHAPQDEELHRIAQALQDAQKRHFYKLTASVKHSGHYYHSGCMDINVEHEDDGWRNLHGDDETVAQALRDFADWIYRRLEEAYEYDSSEEAIAETCEANGYEFYEDGSLV